MANAIRFPIKGPQLDCFSITFLESEKIATNNQVFQSVFNESIPIPTIITPLFN